MGNRYFVYLIIFNYSSLSILELYVWYVGDSEEDIFVLRL